MARIDRVEIHEYTYIAENMGLDEGHRRGYRPGARTKLSNFVVVIRTADGGAGEYACMFGGKKAQLGQVLMLAPLLVGKDASQREAIYNECKRHTRQFGFLGVGMIDICLWDLAGKRLNASVSDLLGGFRTRLPAYASTQNADRFGGLTTKEDYAAFAERCYGLGFRAFKIHGWPEGDVRKEADNVLHIAGRVGDRMKLMLDPACEMQTFADALYLGRACDEAKFFWYEDPLMDGGVSFHAHRKLRQMIRTPILITEQVRGLEPKADCIAAEATDFVRADPELDLGITGTMKIAHLAEAFGLDVELHAVGPAHRHCISAIRNTNFYELVAVTPGARNPVPPVFTCGYSEQLEDVGADGCYPVPQGPGLGVTLDWDYIAANRTQLHAFG